MPRRAQVKFTFKVTLYACFLATYLALLARHHALPHLSVDWLDGVFYLWVAALWLDEAYQWKCHAVRTGVLPWRDFWNLWDAFTWNSLIVAGLTRVFAMGTCDRVGQRTARRLRGSNDDDDAVVGDLTSDETDPDAIYKYLYEGCEVLYCERFILAICFILACARMLQWFKIHRKMGVSVIIIGEVMSDVQVVMSLAAIFIVSFGTAIMGVMPLHGSGPMSADGGFFVPYWAMYGEFGEIEEVGVSGGYVGCTLIWVYTFIVQVVLVNLLIAMLTDTYSKIQQNADNEWKCVRAPPFCRSPLLRFCPVPLPVAPHRHLPIATLAPPPPPPARSPLAPAHCAGSSGSK